jgi:hypothetical protein
VRSAPWKKWTRFGVMKEGPDQGPKSSGYEPSGPLAAGVGPAPHISVAFCGKRLVTLRSTTQGPKLRQCSGLVELPLLLPLCAPSGLVLAHRAPGAFALKDAIAMASASITTRKTKGGGRRYVVRFRLGGRQPDRARRLISDDERGAYPSRPDRR